MTMKTLGALVLATTAACARVSPEEAEKTPPPPTPESIATFSGEVRQLMTQKSHLVWLDGKGDIWRVAKGGGTPQVVRSTAAAVYLAVDDVRAYWTTSLGGVAMTALDGSGSLTQLMSPTGAGSPIAVDGRAVYTLNYYRSSPREIVAIDPSTLEVRTVAEFDELLSPTALVAADGRVIWSDARGIATAASDRRASYLYRDPSVRSLTLRQETLAWSGYEQSVWKGPVGGGVPVRIGAIETLSEGYVALGESSTYWTRERSVQSLNAAGATTTWTTTGATCCVVADEQKVYWAVRNAGVTEIVATGAK